MKKERLKDKMKKFLCLICTVMIVCCACGKAGSGEIDDSLKDSIKSLEQRSVIISNEVIMLDCDVSTLYDAIGESLDESEDVMIESGGKETYELLNDKEEQQCMFTVYNDSENEKSIRDCRVISVAQIKGMPKLITFPGELQIGQEKNKDYIIELFGEPSLIQEYEKYVLFNYNKDENNIRFMLWIEDGVITNISLSAYEGIIKKQE